MGGGGDGAIYVFWPVTFLIAYSYKYIVFGTFFSVKIKQMLL